MALYQPQYGLAGYKPSLPGNQMTAGRVLDAGRTPTTGVGALQRITNPAMPPQALVREVAMPGPGQNQTPQRQVATSTREAQALANARATNPNATLADLRNKFSPAIQPPPPPAPVIPQPKFNPSLPGPGTPKIIGGPYRPVTGPFDGIMLNMPGGPQYNQPTQPNPMGMPGYFSQPAGIPQSIGAFQTSQMSYAPPTQSNPVKYPTLGTPFTGQYQGPTSNQAQQLAAQAARNK